MSYEKHTWETGEVITAEKLNNIESGVSKLCVLESTNSPAGSARHVLDHTWSEIKEMMENGCFCVAIQNNSNNSNTEIICGGVESVTITDSKYCVYFDDSSAVGGPFTANSPDDYPAYIVE